MPPAISPEDASKLLVAIAGVLLGGFMKGLSGMGFPVVATPILATLYDLPTAIAVTIPATLLSDFPMLYRFRSEWREARRIVPLVIPAVVGIVVGTRILVSVDPARLRLLLGVLVLTFVAVAAFGLAPRLDDRTTRRAAPFVGAAAGVLQGSAGQSGPIVAIYFYQAELRRSAFLFVINAFFLVVDSAQLVSLVSYGFYTPERWLQAAGAVCLAGPVLLFALHLHDRIGEAVFRRLVLGVLGLTGMILILRS
jgi:uncharacterized membrane protein YfcA